MAVAKAPAGIGDAGGLSKGQVAPDAVLCGCRPAPALPKKIKREVLESILKDTGGKLQPHEVRALYRRFRLLAPAGYLQPERFRQTMGVLGLTDDPFLPDRMFHVFDANNDGKLSFTEFVSALAVMIRGSEEEKLQLSFEMTAGHRGAAGIRYEDFQHLIRACNNMMQSLVTPDTPIVTEDHIRRMFRDLASDDSDGGPPVITMDDYKAAAQSNEDFLVCLGLQPPAAPVSRSPQRARTMDSQATFLRGTGSGFTTKSAAGRPYISRASSFAVDRDQYLISSAQIDDLRDKVLSLRELVLQERTNRSGWNSSPQLLAVAPPSGLVEDEVEPMVEDSAERWWTPLPKRPGGPRLLNSNKLPLPHAANATPAPRLGDDIALEFDRVLATCSHLGDRFADDDMRRPTTLQQGRSFSGADVPRTPPANGSSGPVGASLGRFAPLEPFGDGVTGSLSTSMGHCRSGQQSPAPDVGSPPQEAVSPMSVDGGRFFDLRGGGRTQHVQSGGTLGDASPAPGGARRRRATSRRRKRHRLLGPKKGLAVHFGHENWNMVLSMMIGIRMSVGRIKHEIARELMPVDFVMKEKFSIIPRLANIFDSEVSKRVTMTRFIDYAPMVFQRIRSSFGIQQDDYLRSVGPEQLLGNMVLGNLSSLSELSSEGKSGAFFYYTADGKYMMKTVSPKEKELLKRMLKTYYDHIMKNSSTLIVRFLGLHCLRIKKYRRGAKSLLQHDRKLHFVVMGNMFNTPFQIHRKYDLKGSTVGRFTADRANHDPSVALKDLDFTQAGEAIQVGKELKEKLLQQIHCDSAFLRDNNVIDYSLLLGIHDINASLAAGNSGNSLGAGLRSEDPEATDTNSDRGMDPPTAEERLEELRAQFHAAQLRATVSGSSTSVGTVLGRLGTSVLGEVPLHQRDLGGLLSLDKQRLYFFGIIDILTPYDTRKRLEHHLKALRHDRRGVSCCPPVFYSERFNDFLGGAFA